MNLRTIPLFLRLLPHGPCRRHGAEFGQVKEAYKADNLTDFTSTLPTFAVFIAFAVFSVPGGLLAARIGKRNLLLLGLGLERRPPCHSVVRPTGFPHC